MAAAGLTLNTACWLELSCKQSWPTEGEPICPKVTPCPPSVAKLGFVKSTPSQGVRVANLSESQQQQRVEEKKRSQIQVELAVLVTGKSVFSLTKQWLCQELLRDKTQGTPRRCVKQFLSTAETQPD